MRDYFGLVRAHPDFVSFSIKRFVYLTGSTLAMPLFPLYYVREVNASDAAIGLINTAQTIVLLFGYYFWTPPKPQAWLPLRPACHHLSA